MASDFPPSSTLMTDQTPCHSTSPMINEQYTSLQTPVQTRTSTATFSTFVVPNSPAPTPKVAKPKRQTKKKSPATPNLTALLSHNETGTSNQPPSYVQVLDNECNMEFVPLNTSHGSRNQEPPPPYEQAVTAVPRPRAASVTNNNVTQYGQLHSHVQNQPTYNNPSVQNANMQNVNMAQSQRAPQQNIPLAQAQGMMRQDPYVQTPPQNVRQNVPQSQPHTQPRVPRPQHLPPQMGACAPNNIPRDQQVPNDNRPQGQHHGNFPSESICTIAEANLIPGELFIPKLCICKVVELQDEHSVHPLVYPPRRKLVVADNTGVMIGFIKRPQPTHFEQGDTIRMRGFTMKNGHFLIHSNTVTSR